MSDRFDLEAAASDAIAIADDAGDLTYAELAALARTRGRELVRAGLDVARGDRLLFVPRVDRESVITLLAALDLRATIVLAHPRWTKPELARAITLTAPRVVITDAIETHTTPAHDRSPALIVFTTGSSGAPKAACLSRAALLAAAEAHARALPWEPGDRWKLAMPLAHIGGASVVLRSLYARAAIVMGAREATLLSVVPAMLDHLPPARAILVGGAACPSSTLARLRDQGAPLLPTYGLTEMCGQVCTQRLDDPRPHGVGPPLPGIEVRIVDGAIEARGPTRMDGFLGETLSSDWYRTGDLGELDARGHLLVRGRIDDRIVTGGENVDPVEVEDALVSHPRVAACCVVGTPDPRWGQTVAALVVAQGDLDERTLREHLDARLARFKHPRRWAFVASLPLVGGKIDRRAARNSWSI
jgi:O-succinylbenzoic acid--CoA ligase